MNREAELEELLDIARTAVIAWKHYAAEHKPQSHQTYSIEHLMYRIEKKVDLLDGKIFCDRCPGKGAHKMSCPVGGKAGFRAYVTLKDEGEKDA